MSEMERLNERLAAAKAARDDAKAQYEACAALERQAIDRQRELMRSPLADPIELHNEGIRASSYQAQGRRLWEQLQTTVAAVRSAEQEITKYRREPVRLREALALAESAVNKHNIAAIVASLERMISDARRTHADLVASRDNIAATLNRVEMEIETYG